LSMSLEAFSREFSTSILRLLYTSKTFDLVWIWLGGDYGNVFLMGFDGIQWIETTEEGTKILATVDGIVRTISESSLRRNLKLRDEERISSLPDANLFENLTLMGYNISPNQKFTFQKGRVVPLFDAMLVPQGEGSRTPTEPHYTPSPKAQTPSNTTQPTSTLPPVSTTSISTVSHTETTPIWQYTRRARIDQSSALPPVADEPASPSSNLPHDSAPRVTSPVANEGSSGGGDSQAKGKGRSMDEGKAATERISDDTEEMAMILTSIDAATVLAGGIDDVPTGSGSIPTAGPPATDISTGSDVVPTSSPVFATATVVTPYLRRKGKEFMVESDTPKKQRLQEQIDAQVARELEEQQEREDKRMSEQIDRDAEVVRIHAEGELQSMIDGLDRNNETIAMYLQEYQ
nr:hypothetical protein [Tanacetum cinerariifolium]